MVLSSNKHIECDLLWKVEGAVTLVLRRIPEKNYVFPNIRNRGVAVDNRVATTHNKSVQAKHPVEKLRGKVAGLVFKEPPHYKKN